MKKSMVLAVTVIGIIFTFALLNGAWAAQSESDVQIIYDGTPKTPYKAIGRVSIDKFKNIFGTKRSQEEIERMMKKEAFKKGGDAVMSIREDLGSVNAVIIVFEGKKAADNSSGK
jgi:hypothetical protein